jgi:predicted AlkP superfamily pyrophosphatase or phosphodiesterase
MVFGLAALAMSCSPEGQALREKRLLLIGLDGVRVDILVQAATPHIDSLIADGVFTDRARTRPPTVSGPGWSSMLTGVWADKHGVTGNDFTANDYAAYPDFLTRLERIDETYGTFAVLDWPPLATTASGGPLVGDVVDRKILIDGDSLGYEVADSQSVEAAVAVLAAEDIDAAFVYLGNIDVVGHELGSLSTEYRVAIEQADRWVGALVEAIMNRSTHNEEDWLILISTDHGRRDDGGHGGESIGERTIFYLASGSAVDKEAVLAEVGIVDVAVTALYHLGVTIDPAWGLDGRVVGLPPEQR